MGGGDGDGDTCRCTGDPREPHCAPAPGWSDAGPHRVPKPSASSPLPQHHSQACLSAHCGALPLLSGAPLGNRGQWGGGCPPGWGTCPKAPQGLGQRGPPSRCAHAVLLSPLCPGTGDRVQRPPHVPTEGPPCPPQTFLGCQLPHQLHQPERVSGSRCPGCPPSPLSPPSPRQLTVSPGPVGAFWAVHPPGGPSSAPPPAPFVPPHPPTAAPLARGSPHSPVCPGRSHRQPAPGCPAQQVPPLRLNIDRWWPRGRAARHGGGQCGGGGRRGHLGPGSPGGVTGAPASAGGPRPTDIPPLEPWGPHRAPTAAAGGGGGRLVRAAGGVTGPRGCWGGPPPR